MREGWEVKELKKVAKVFNGNSINAKEKTEKYTGLEKGTPFIATKDVSFGHQIDYNNGVLIPEPKSSEFKIAPVNSVLVCAEGGSAGRKIAHNDRNINFGNKLFAIVPNATVDSTFIFYYCINKDFYDAFSENMAGIIGGVSLKKFQTLFFPIPPLPEQKRIVAILDEAFEGIDRAIANAEKNLANSRELFESYLNNVFTQKGDGWVESKLVDICSIKHGFAFKSQFFTDTGNYILLTPGSFYESGGYREQGLKTKYYVGEIPEGYILNKGDFIFAMTEQAVGLLGASLIVPEDDLFLHNQRLGLVQIADSIAWHNDFFFHQFNTKRFRAAVQVSASGVKVRHTSPTKLGEISVYFPSTKGKQKFIADELNELLIHTQHLETIYQQKLTALTELKQSLLHKAFSGELTADVPVKKKAVA